MEEINCSVKVALGLVVGPPVQALGGMVLIATFGCGAVNSGGSPGPRCHWSESGKEKTNVLGIGLASRRMLLCCLFSSWFHV